MVLYAFWVTDGYSERVLNDGRPNGRDSSSLAPRGSKEVRQLTNANVETAYIACYAFYTLCM